MYKILIPLIIPGISTAVLFTFIPAFGNFAIPDIVGGTDVRMLGILLMKS
jgi:spermidine/putrescine transport system permease protein